MELGFIGLGIMGAPMCGHLIAAGHTLHVHTRSQVPAALVEAGARPCASAAEVAQRADVVFTMLPDTPDVEKVLFGASGIATGLAAAGTAARDKLVVDMSSISPIATKDLRSALPHSAPATWTRRSAAAKWARRTPR